MKPVEVPGSSPVGKGPGAGDRVRAKRKGIGPLPNRSGPYATEARGRPGAPTRARDASRRSDPLRCLPTREWRRRRARGHAGTREDPRESFRTGERKLSGSVQAIGPTEVAVPAIGDLKSLCGALCGKGQICPLVRPNASVRAPAREEPPRSRCTVEPRSGSRLVSGNEPATRARRRPPRGFPPRERARRPAGPKSKWNPLPLPDAESDRRRCTGVRKSGCLARARATPARWDPGSGLRTCSTRACVRSRIVT